MNKTKVSKKEMKENYYILRIGYCNAQQLLRYETPFAYSSGANGWNCDYYNIDNVIISEGYSPLDNKNIKSTYEELQKLEKKANTINHNYELTYEEQKKKVQRILRNYIKKIKKEN